MKYFNTVLLRKRGSTLARLAGLCLPFCASTISAQIVLDLPEVELQAGSAAQNFSIFVNNSGSPFAVTGLSLNLQTADGGPPAGGSILAPSILDIEIFSGALFQFNNNGASGSGSIVPQIFERGTLTSSGTVTIPTGSTKLATVTINTESFSAGSTFSMTLDTLNGPSRFTTSTGDFFPSLAEGEIRLAAVPEPAETGLVTGLLLAAVVGYRSRFARRS